ncbi:MAG TPA: 16S rRNA (guanine(966)-N(2))-methyltransferase RsmD [Dehalococcoidia bacterium]|nr:16S rRNA (guanine(966)-N(2))-methyltransferase RsmD [Dehalococcoidia bacterium]
MRVIAGTAKGRRLIAPRGARTRPTADRTRGAIFDMLEAAGADFTSVLDLYAGTGALGIEALSRGADGCDFVEQDRNACEAIRRNLRLTGLEERSRVSCMSVSAALGRLDRRYTLVLADPPYADTEAIAELDRLASVGLANGAFVVYEHSIKHDSPAHLGELPRWRQRRHGDAMISIYRAGHTGPPGDGQWKEE